MTSDHVTSCEGCGASIYPEHLDSGIARYEGGKLLCSHCAAEYEQAHDAAAGGESDEDFAPIELEGFDDVHDAKVEMSSSQIHGATAATLGKAGGWDDAAFKRPLRPDGVGGTRCRVFHCRLSEGAVEYMNNQVNEWLDASDDIVVKFCNSTIGLFEGKHTEPNLILTVFY